MVASARSRTRSARPREQVAARILRDLGAGKGEIVVLNDEAHHCYQDKLLDIRTRRPRRRTRTRNREARVWFRGLQPSCEAAAGVKAVYDLSATPYYLKGSGYNEGFIFPWAVSDFSLMDAIESGIVKVPRIPVDDDATDEGLAYLRPVGQHRAAAAQADQEGRRIQRGRVDPPETLEGALRSLYRSYATGYTRYEKRTGRSSASRRR